MVEKNQKTKQSKLIQWSVRILVICVFLIVFFMIANSPHEYPERTRIAEAGAIATMATIAVEKYFNEHNQFPPNNLSAELPSPSAIQTLGMSSLEVSTTGSGNETKAQIILTFNKKVVKDKTIILSAIAPKKGERLIWDCKGGTLAKQFRPSECR